MRMEVLSSSYSRAASPLSSGAVDGLAGAGAGARPSPEKKCVQMARTTCSGSWKEATAVLENDTEEPAAGIDGPSAMATGTKSASAAPGALLKSSRASCQGGSPWEQRCWGRAGAGAGRQGAATGSGPCAP